MKRPTLALWCLAVVVPAAAALAQQACPMEMNVPAMTLADMYKKSEAKAKAWKPDVVPSRITNTSMGPLDDKGRSEAWNVVFFSPSAKQTVTMTTFRGMFSCFAMNDDGGRLPDLKPGFFRDGAKLYAIAKEKGGGLVEKGYQISVGTAAAPETRHATWNISFSKDNSNAGPLILVDANTGAVEKVLDTD
jgi:hypothetical protein